MKKKKEVKIGSNACVMKDVESHTTVFGCPAKPIFKRR